MTKKIGDPERKDREGQPGGERRHDKQARLARALRANLERRKAQARARAAEAKGDKGGRDKP
ncbi:MAG: hypothetical protein IT564_01350 [Rhodospirillales bacterium]|nr:hypothetical protein [Rhodospirillales bacterium]